MHHSLFFLNWLLSLPLLLTLKMSQSLLEDFAQSHTDSTRQRCNPSFWLSKASLPLFFFPPTDLFYICTYQRKLRRKGKTSRFGFLLLISQSYKGKAQTATWFRSSQVQSSQSQWGHLLVPTQACFPGIQDGTGGPSRGQPGRGLSSAAVSSERKLPERPVNSGEAAFRLRRAVQFCNPAAGKTEDASEETAFSSVSRTTRIVAPKISCLISKFSGIIVLHWSHKNITLLFL